MSPLGKPMLAEFMTFSECVDWLAFGLLPVPMPCENGRDERRDISTILRWWGVNSHPRDRIGAETIGALFPDFPVEAYQSALMPKEFREVLDVEDYMREALLGNISWLDVREIVATSRRIRLEQEIEKEILGFYEREIVARLDAIRVTFSNVIWSVFACGHLKFDGLTSIGHRWSSSPKTWRMQEIQPEDWEQVDLDLKRSALRKTGRECLTMTASTKEVLRIYPCPSLNVRPRLNDYLDFGVAVEDLPVHRTAPTRPKGARRKATREQVSALKDEFRQRFNTGRFNPRIDKEKAEAAVWMSDKFGLTISPATAGRYLGSVLGDHPVRKNRNSEAR